MERQLVLVEAKKDWKLDSATRETGLRGIAKAREVLRQAAKDDHKAA